MADNPPVERDAELDAMHRDLLAVIDKGYKLINARFGLTESNDPLALAVDKAQDLCGHAIEVLHAVMPGGCPDELSDKAFVA